MRRAPRLPSATVATVCLCLIGLIAGCGGDGDSGSSGEGAKTVPLMSAEGGEAGTVKFTPAGEGVDVEADVSGLTPGFHGFHVHETGTCEPDAPMGAFDTAGGHFASGSQTHGDHVGDMPTLLAGKDGTARATFTTERFTVEDLADEDGSAVMVHADLDNQANIPDRYRAGKQPGADEETLDTGDSGDRVACGVVTKSP